VPLFWKECRMSKQAVYPRSSARPIYVMAGILGLLGLAGVIVMLVAMADVPRQSYYLLIAAFGLLIVALAGALAMLLATNTRRPWGIDPNLGPQYSAQPIEEADPYATSTEELLRHAVQLPDGNGYGRRQSDDKSVVRRLASVEQEERSLPPLPPQLGRPAWATEILPLEYREEPPKHIAEEPAPPFTERPLDQLDLVPASSDNGEPSEQRVDASG
jgi:hypothetical protein